MHLSCFVGCLFRGASTATNTPAYKQSLDLHLTNTICDCTIPSQILFGDIVLILYLLITTVLLLNLLIAVLTHRYSEWRHLL